MRWIIDAQLPPALAALLARHGHEAEHVIDLSLAAADDSAIWAHALANGSIVLTKDEDFSIRALVSTTAPVIVWIRKGNCTRRALLTWFEPLLPDIVERITQGETLIEVR